MSANLAMGLRADEAREILKNNGYTQKESVYVNYTCNDGSAYLYSTTMFLGALIGTALDKTLRCSASWINDPSSCELEKPLIPIAIGGFLGLCIPICLLRMIDKNESTEVECINRLRKSVMKIIDDNYRDCDFHRPLKGVHVSDLLRLTDEQTQRQLLYLLNEAQIAQTLKDKNIGCSTAFETLKSIQNKVKLADSLTEFEWESAAKSEIEFWANLKESLINNQKEEIGKAYAACRDVFGASPADSFVKKHMTNANLRTIYKLSDHLAQYCEHYYQNNRSEIETQNYFK